MTHISTTDCTPFDTAPLSMLSGCIGSQLEGTIDFFANQSSSKKTQSPEDDQGNRASKAGVQPKAAAGRQRAGLHRPWMCQCPGHPQGAVSSCCCFWLHTSQSGLLGTVDTASKHTRWNVHFTPVKCSPEGRHLERQMGKIS